MPLPIWLTRPPQQCDWALVFSSSPHPSFLLLCPSLCLENASPHSQRALEVVKPLISPGDSLQASLRAKCFPRCPCQAGRTASPRLQRGKTLGTERLPRQPWAQSRPPEPLLLPLSSPRGAETGVRASVLLAPGRSPTAFGPECSRCVEGQRGTGVFLRGCGCHLSGPGPLPLEVPNHPGLGRAAAGRRSEGLWPALYWQSESGGREGARHSGRQGWGSPRGGRAWGAQLLLLAFTVHPDPYLSTPVSKFWSLFPFF